MHNQVNILHVQFHATQQVKSVVLVSFWDPLKDFKAVKHFNWRSNLRCHVTLWAIEIFDKLAISLLIECSFPRWSLDRLLNPEELVSLVPLMDWVIKFSINSRQRTSHFSVRSSDYLPNPAPQNRRFPCFVHNNDPASRSLLTLNSRIPAFK